MDAFKITLTLASPLVAQKGGYMTLDGPRYERDPSVRKAALTHHGKTCMACGFAPKVDMQLEVHHLKPIAEGERLTSLADVAVLCANCHRLAHSEEPPLPWVTMRTLVVWAGLMGSPHQQQAQADKIPPLNS